MESPDSMPTNPLEPSSGRHPRAPNKANPGAGLAVWRWPLTILLLAAMALFAYFYSLRGFGDWLGQVTGIAAKFSQEKITDTFLAGIPEITVTGESNLEVALATATEVFRRTDDWRVLWDNLSLGTTATEIIVPVTYRYHLRLNDPWKLTVRDQTCIVVAPRIRPSQPPAIHTDKMVKHIDESFLRFNAQDQMDELEKSLTPALIRYAGDPKHIALVREQCRRSVAEFVRKWLLSQNHWREDRFHAITVIFADEPAGSVEMAPTLTLTHDESGQPLPN